MWESARQAPEAEAEEQTRKRVVANVYFVTFFSSVFSPLSFLLLCVIFPPVLSILYLLLVVVVVVSLLCERW